MRIPVAVNESLAYIGILLVVDLILLVLGYFFNVPRVIAITISLICLLLFIFILYFFRDPERNIIKDEEKILSPADGKVVEIVEEEDKEYSKSQVKRISIFLSVFNVHIQRAPVAGNVEMVKHKKGKFLPAWEPLASMDNEQNSIGITFNNKGKTKKILVKQIAGILARRTVAWIKEKDDIKLGQKIGMIKFGSRVDVLFPKEIEVTVKIGDKVKAGETIIGVMG
jgi:phosphatidylserine decarboxylase